MGPTCSIIYESEPIEKQASLSKPRSTTKGFLSFSELSISIIQGLVISAGVLFLYYYTMKEGLSERQIRTLVFTNIVVANIFLTLENRSFKESIIKTLSYKNPLILLIISLTVFLLICILYFFFYKRAVSFRSYFYEADYCLRDCSIFQCFMVGRL
ncbi:MAG: cation-translocating P-type ATPase C-terminal domain-containing protein [Sporocytophaga sp.]|nr:cation-translocating P-type ATPase C-terminal domain-containing protein [Sporocytophaga sp.]